MACVHLKELFQLCQENQLRFSASDLIHIACPECGEQEVCPSVLTDEYDAKAAAEQVGQGGESKVE